MTKTETGRQTDREGDRQKETDRQTDRETQRERDRQTDRQTVKQTDRQRDRQADRQTDKETDRQRQRQTEKETEIETETERKIDEGRGDGCTCREQIAEGIRRLCLQHKTNDGNPLIKPTCGVTVSMSAFLACHQCYCAGSSLAWGLNLRAVVCGIF